MKITIAVLLLSMLLFGILYIAFAFIKADINPIQWGEDARVVLVIIWVVLNLPLLGIAGELK